MAALFSVSDGPQETGDGIPYFYVSPLQAAVTDLTNVSVHTWKSSYFRFWMRISFQNNANCSLLMSLAQTSICKENNWDPEDPRCAQVILSGTFQKIQNTSEEYPKAKEAIFSRHPSFVSLPASHKFFLAKINIERIIVQDRFGGPSVVPVHDYFSVSGPKADATSRSCSLESNLLILALLLEIIGLYFNL